MGSFNGKWRDRNPGRRRGAQSGRKRTLPELESLESRRLLAGPSDSPPAWHPTSLDPADVKNGPLANAGQELINIYLEYQAYKQAGGQPNQFHSSQANTIRFQGNQVGVYVRSYGDFNTFVSLLSGANINMSIQSKSATSNMVAGFVPIDNLINLANLKQTINGNVVQTVGLDPISIPIVNSQGVANNQAEQVLQIDTARQQFNVDGTGVTVGVISDSVNRYQGGLNDSISTGDLPPLNRINVLQDEPVGGNNTDEGRAMMEEIYDVAPGANLAFHTGFIDQLNFAQGILDLSRVAGAQVIVDDVSYRDEPFFQPGPIEQAISTVVNTDHRIYFSSAGNQADKGLASPFRATTATITGIGTGTFMNFAPAGSAVTTQMPLTVNSPGQLVFQYDQPFYTTNGVSSDLDVYVLDANGNIVASGTSNNIASQTPEEVVSIPTAGSYTVAVFVKSGTAPSRIQFREFGGDMDFSKQFGSQGGITYPTSVGHNAGVDTIGVGAVPWFNAPPYGNQNPLRNEDFSSFGPRNLVFDAQGNRLSSPMVLQRPQVSGVDGVNTSFFPPGGDIPQDPDTLPNFFGTSAAAPNLAAMAALMRQLSPGVSQADVLKAMQDSAVALNGTPKGTWDAQGGYGMPQAVSALSEVDRLRITATNPPNNATLSSGFKEFAIVFNKPIDVSTLQSSDLQFTQVPSGVSGSPSSIFADPNNPTFAVFNLNITHQPGVKSNGIYKYTFADGSILSKDDTKSLAAYSGSFTLNDTVSPQVTGTTFNARTITVQFSEPMDPTTITSSNFILVRTGSSGVFGNPTNVILNSYPGFKVTYNNATNQAIVDLSALPQSALPSDRYALVIEDKVTDIVGNKLDGEFNGVFPSGNGLEGGKFVQDLPGTILRAPNILSVQLSPASDTGIKGDRNTRATTPSFDGLVSAAFPGTVAGLQVVVQFNALHNGTIDLQQGSNGRGFTYTTTLDYSTTTDANGRFTIKPPSALPDGFQTVRVIVVGQPDSPPLPGLSSVVDQSFRIDTTSPLVITTSPTQLARISNLSAGVDLNVADPVLPSALGDPLAVPTQFQITALDPSTATNISNYSLYNLGSDNQLGGTGTAADTDYSNFITGATYTDTSNRQQTSDWYSGKIHLSFATGLPAGRYMLVARYPQPGYQGITDSAGNPLDGNPSQPGIQNFALQFDLQPVPSYITNVMAVSPAPTPTNPNAFTVSGPRSYFEIPVPGVAPRAPAPPNAFVVDFSGPLDPNANYNNLVWLIRSADSPTSPPDGDFGVDPSFTNGIGYTRISGTTVTLENSILGATYGQPGYKNRLVLRLPAGTTLPADHYRLFIPNAIQGGQDLRIFDIFGNQIDGEFLGNPTPQGGWEDLLPNGQYRAGMSGDGVAGGGFETGYVVVPNGNVIFAKPDVNFDPGTPSSLPDGSPQKPYPVLAPEAVPNAINGGDLNSPLNFGTNFNPNLDINGDGHFDPSAFYAASVKSQLGPVVIVALPADTGDPLNRTFVLQKPTQNPALPTIQDGSASVPYNTLLVFQPGSILKMQNASLFVQNQGSAIQFNGGPNPNQKVYVTSYLDDSIGGDTNGDGNPFAGGGGALPQPGDYGGIVLRNFDDTSNGGRPIPVAPGPVDPNRPYLGLSGADDSLSSLNYGVITYGGGAVPQSIGFRFDAITLFNSRPAITNTIIDGRQLPGAAPGPNGGSQAGISGDMDSFREDPLARGPLIRRTSVTNTSLNGIYVRAELNGAVEPTDAIHYVNNPSSLGGQQNYTFDDPLPYLLVARMDIGDTLLHNTGNQTTNNSIRVYIQPGMMFKFQRGSAIDTTNPNVSLNVGDRTYIRQFDANPNLAPTDPGFKPENTGDARVVFTSLFDDNARTYFVDPNTGAQTTIVAPIDSDNAGSTNLPTPGNVPDLARWGGISILSGVKTVIDEANFYYGGGTVNEPSGTIGQRDVLAFQGAGGNSAFGVTVGALGTRAYITNNDFYDNKEAPMSITPNGLLAADPLRPLISGNPFFRGNIMQRNDINGLEVIPVPGNRNGSTVVGYPANLSVDSVWDDTDLTYVLRSTIVLSGVRGFAIGGPNGFPMPDLNNFTAEQRPYLTLTIQSSLPGTLLANGDTIPKPGESVLVKLLNDLTVPPAGDGANGMPSGSQLSDTRGGAGFLVGFDDGVDPTPDPLIDPGVMSQIRILGIGGNETTGQQRVPAIITSLRDNSVGKTVRGVTMNAATTPAYLATIPGGVVGGDPTAGPQPGDGGVIGFGANSLSDYNLMDPRDGNLIDNADIKYITRIEMQGGGWAYSSSTDGSGAGITAKVGTTPALQLNTAKAMTISNSNLYDFSQAGVIAHPSGVNQIHLLLFPPQGTAPIARDGTFRGEPVLLFLYNNTIANMPVGVRINSETVDNTGGPNPYEAVILNNTFYNDDVAIHTVAPAYNGQNSLSHVYFLAMDNIFANSSDVAVRVEGQGTGSQLQYNLFSGNNNNVDTSTAQFIAGPFNAQPIFGQPAFRDPANGDFSLTSLSDAIDAARSEIGPIALGLSLQPIATQNVTNIYQSVRNATGRSNPFGGLGSATSGGDLVTLPGYPPGQRGYYDQWVPASITPGSPIYTYTPITGERDAAGFLRVDDPNRANVGFGSRPFFDVGAYEYRQLFPPTIIDVTALLPNPSNPSSPIPINLYKVGGVSGTNVNPQAIQIKFNQRIDPATVNNLTFLLQASGGDGIFGNNNNSQDRFIPLSGKLSYDPNTQTVTIGVGNLGLNLTNDLYRITVLGNGDNVVRNPQGLPLDGEDTVGGSPNGLQLPLPSGNGIPGGDFFVTFAIDTHPPAVVPGTVRLAPDTDNRPNDNITNNPLPTFTGQITDVPPPTNPLLGQTVIVDISTKGNGVYDILDAGQATTDAQGNFSVTLTKKVPDTNYNVGPDGILGTADDSGYSVARIRVVDQSGNTSNLNDPNALVPFVVDTQGPRITGTSPLPGAQATVNNGTVSVAIAVNENFDPSTLNSSTIKAVRAGGDGIFGNGNDVPVNVDLSSLQINYLQTPTGSEIIRFNLTGITTNDLYRVTLVGSGNGVTDIAGNLVDGEYNGSFPTGNGQPGGDFNLDFIVLNPAFSKTIFVSASATNPTPTGTRFDPYSTIAAGLAAASVGDTVAVLGGTPTGSAVVYNEAVQMKSLVRLVSADPSSTDSKLVPGTALKTVIRAPYNAGQATSPAVKATDLVSIPSFPTEVAGFTISSPLSGNNQTSPIQNGSIGVLIENSNILLDKNYIIDSNFGVAVSVYGTSRAPQIVNNGLIGNIYGLLINDVNGSTTSFQGGQDVKVINNTVAFNTTGIFALTDSTGPILADLDNNIFWQNADRTVYRNGQAILATNPNRLKVLYNLFSANGPSVSSPADDTVGVGGGFNPSLLGPTPDANGNLTGNPSFVSPLDPRPDGNGPGNFFLGANYDITSTSAAIDRGLDAVAPPTDFLNRGRVDIPNVGTVGTKADIGAFEYNGTSGNPVTTFSLLSGSALASQIALAQSRPTAGFGSGVTDARLSSGSVTLSFSSPVDRSTVQATDLLLSGNGLDPSNPARATSLSWIDNQTVKFNLSGNFLSTGSVLVDLPPGAVQNANHTLVPEYSQSLPVPSSAPVVTPAVVLVTTAPVTVPNTTAAGQSLRNQQLARRQALAQAKAKRGAASGGNFLNRLAAFRNRNVKQ